MIEARAKMIGWARPSLVAMDAMAPGVMDRVLTAPPVVCHAILTVVADRILNGLVVDGTRRSDDESADEFDAWVFRLEEPEHILAHAFAEVPAGWLQALEAIGDAPMGCPQAYFRLRNIFSKPSYARLAEALSGLTTITEETLRIAGALDERWLCTETLARLLSVAKAEEFNFTAAFAQAVNSKATDDAVLSAITRLKPHETLEDMLLQFVQEADEFPYMPVGQATDVEKLAIITRNDHENEAPDRRMVVVIRCPDERGR